jgi:segregation and condensation protein B
MTGMTIDNSEDLTPETVAAIVQNLLFVADAPVTVQELAAAIDCGRDVIEQALAYLRQSNNRLSLQIQRHGQKVQLVTAPEATVYIERFLGLSFTSKLSTAALETLAMIAYRQPIARSEIEAIRGVNSDGVLRTLLSKGLIEEKGRLETVGRPILFGTTFQFLQYFGLGDLESLPLLEPDANGTTDEMELQLSSD